MIDVTPEIQIDEREVTETFLQAGGPGGQNVNKVATAVQLRFDARNSPAITEAVFERLRRLAGRRMTRDGVLVITARRFRHQQGNRQDALARLVDLIRRAAAPPTPRRPTKASRASRQRRLTRKKQRGQLKQNRARPSRED